MKLASTVRGERLRWKFLKWYVGLGSGKKKRRMQMQRKMRSGWRIGECEEGGVGTALLGLGTGVKDRVFFYE